MTKCMKAHGVASAAFDVAYGQDFYMEGKQDAMNILSDSGFSCFVGIDSKQSSFDDGGSLDVGEHQEHVK